MKRVESELREKIIAVDRRIEKAAARCGRDPGDIRLLAVSKTKSADTVKEAMEAGATILGENYIQEARDKIEALRDYPVSWHFIGHLQSNKAKLAVKLFDLIHSVDSLKLARAIDRQAAGINKIQAVLIQANVGNEPSKSGVSPAEVIHLVRDISPLENVSVTGLMTIPPFFDNPEDARPYFSALRGLAEQISRLSIPGVTMEELSMGMTGDFEVAIEEGATLVRVGTAIFGKRQ